MDVPVVYSVNTVYVHMKKMYKVSSDLFLVESLNKFLNDKTCETLFIVCEAVYYNLF